MVTDSAGNTYLRGTFTGSLYFGAVTLTVGPAAGGPSSGYLAKFDSNGNCLWAKEHPVFMGGKAIALDRAGHLYLAGTYSGPSVTLGAVQLTSTATGKLLVARLDPAGNFQWARQVESTGGILATALAVDAANNVYVTGGLYGGVAQIGASTVRTTPGGSGYSTSDLFVAKLGANGAWEWGVSGQRPFRPADNDAGMGIAVDRAGLNVYVTGVIGSSNVGGIVTLGGLTLNSTVYTDAFVARLTSAGTWVWAQNICSQSYDRGVAVAVDAYDNVYCYGFIQASTSAGSYLNLTNTNRSAEVFVAKLRPDASVVWTRTAGGTQAEVPTDMTLDAAGNVYLTGWFDSAPATFGTTTLYNPAAFPGVEHDGFVAKLDTDGQWQWALAVGGAYVEDATGVSVGPDGNVWVSGSSYSASATFGTLGWVGINRRQLGYLARIGEVPLATIATVTPNNGGPGQAVTLTGTHFTGVTSVAFGGVPADSFTVTSATSLRAIVPAGARSGPVTVRTASSGSGPGPSFQVLALSAASARSFGAAVWPNPVGAPAALNLRLHAPLPAGQRAHLQLTTLIGRVVLSRELTSPTAQLQLPALAAGSYLLTLRLPGQAPAVQRLVVE